MFDKTVKKAIKIVVAFAMVIASVMVLQKQVWADSSPKVLTEDQIVTNNIVNNPITEPEFPGFVSNALPDGTLPNGSDKTQDSTEGMIWTDKYIEKTDIPGKYIITFYGIGYKYRTVDDKNTKTDEWNSPLAANTEFVFTEQIPDGFYVEKIDSNENKVLQGLNDGVIVNDSENFGVVFNSSNIIDITGDETLAFKFKVSFNVILSENTTAGTLYQSSEANVHYTPSLENYYYYKWGTIASTYSIGGMSWNNSDDGFKGINDIGLMKIPDISNNSFDYQINKKYIQENNDGVYTKIIDTKTDSTLNTHGISSLEIYAKMTGTGSDKIANLKITINYTNNSIREFEPVNELHNSGGNTTNKVEFGDIILGEIITKDKPSLRDEFKNNYDSQNEYLYYTHDNIIELMFKDPKQKGDLMLNKTAKWNGTNYTISLEAYTTGTVSVTTSSEPLDIVLVLDQSGSMGKYNLGSISRQKAMKSSVNEFISNVAKNSNGQEEKHRLAIVTFGTNVNQLELSDNSLTEVTNENVEIIKSKVNSLQSGGVTRIDYGLMSAYNILQNDNSNRKKVVILFSDGHPVRTSELYDYTGADTAVNYAYQIKNLRNSEIYCIGIFDNANANQLWGTYKSNTENIEAGSKDYQWYDGSISYMTGKEQAANRLLNFISSNFKDKNNDGLIESGDYFKITDDDYNRQSDKYYLTANNPEDLNNVFNTISTSITTPSQDIDSTAIVCDQLSEYFKFASNKELSIKKQKYLGNDTWSDNLEDVTGIQYEFNETSKTFTLTGYDFNENCITEPQGAIPANGYKLIISFNVDPESWFIGGNKVPTNNYDNSGIKYNDEFLNHFETPFVDVDINYGVVSKNLAIYRGNDEENILDQLIDKNLYIINNVQYDLSQYPNADEFVNIDYEYKIDEVPVNEINTTILDETTNVSINPIVTPKYDGSKTDVKDTIDYNVTNAGASIYILVPQINSTNLEMMVEDTTNLDERLTLEKWDCNDNTYDSNNVFTIGNEPILTYYYQSKAQFENNNSFTPNESGIYEFKYNVYNGNILITNDSSFNHDNTNPEITDEHEQENKCNFNHFYVKVLEGIITINKKILNDNDVSLDDGLPIFTFKIEKLDSDNNVISTIYRHIQLKENYTDNQSIVISGLGAGKYRITELPSLRYQIDNNSMITQEVIISKDNNMTNAYFVNTRKSDDYFSDNGIIVNKFVIKDGQLTIKRASDSNSDIDQ